MVSKFARFLRYFKWYRRDQGGSWRKVSRGWVPTSEAKQGEIRLAKEKYPEKKANVLRRRDLEPSKK